MEYVLSADRACVHQIGSCPVNLHGIHQLNWTLVHHNLLTSSKQKQTNNKSHPKLIFTSTRSSIHFPITCYNLLTNQQRFDSRGVTNIQYCYVYHLHISPSLITVARMHSTLHLCSSNHATLHNWNQDSHRFKSCSSHPMRLSIDF